MKATLTMVEIPTPRRQLPGGHRPYNPQTIYAQLMLKKGVRVNHVARVTGIHERLISNYLARRSRPTVRSQAQLGRYFGLAHDDYIDAEGLFKLAPGFEPPVTEDTPPTTHGKVPIV